MAIVLNTTNNEDTTMKDTKFKRKTRTHYILFVRNTPFKQKVVEARHKYIRHCKYPTMQFAD